MSPSRYNWRLICVAVTLLTVLTGLGVRLALLHLAPNESLQARIRSIRYDEKKILVGRGRILDRKGNLLALDLPAQDVFADPKIIAEQGHLRFIARHLSRVLNLDPAIVVSRLNRPRKRFVYVKRYVEQDVADQLSELRLTGVHFDATLSRRYPQGALASHVVGFSNWEGTGSAGVEQKFNLYLRGRPGLRVSQRDGLRREVYERRTFEMEAKQGADIHLTIDQNIQFMVESALDVAMDEHSAKGAWAIVQRISTGEILAMASRPHYDLNAFRESTAEERRNRSISTVYEPGSTFKVVTIAAALNEGTVRPEQVFDCEYGQWYYRGRPLRDYHGYGDLTVADVLKKSSNIGAAKIALTLGRDRLEKCVRNFGFGASTGIQLPGEESGIFRDHKNWSAISATRIAMGHEIAVTALQMLNAVCAIANSGTLMRPYLVEKIVDAKGRVVRQQGPEVISQPISEQTAEVMRRLLARVTDKGGTGAKARIPGYRVAGKTGTAQKPMPGGYSDTAHIASFVGFAPATWPELGIIVVVDEPQPLHTGGFVAAPVFRQIGEEALRYLGVPTDLKLETGNLKPEYKNRSFSLNGPATAGGFADLKLACLPTCPAETPRREKPGRRRRETGNPASEFTRISQEKNFSSYTQVSDFPPKADPPPEDKFPARRKRSSNGNP